jgi:fermentation-respiration switch protein FrsA (DUF1100 family)
VYRLTAAGGVPWKDGLRYEQWVVIVVMPRPVAYLPPDPDPVLVATHLAAGAGTGLLLVLGVAAYTRRGSRLYLLVVLALAALAARTAISLSAMFGVLPAGLHHFVEHALDAMVATFLLAAIYDARRGEPVADATVTDEEIHDHD